jgi:DNA-binding response OmpR family regulator
MIKLIRQNPDIKNTKILVFTSLGSEDMRNRALELGADIFLPKPGTEEALSVIVEWLEPRARLQSMPLEVNLTDKGLEFILTGRICHIICAWEQLIDEEMAVDQLRTGLVKSHYSPTGPPTNDQVPKKFYDKAKGPLRKELLIRTME